MIVETTPLSDVLILTPRRHGDVRGSFMEAFRQDVFDQKVPGVAFVQDNQSWSAKTGTVRGLHFQRPPMAQGKLVRVIKGAILDVAVDVRAGSATYGRHVSVELSADNARQLWIPSGFLHGFCTLTDDTEVLYKATQYYSPPHDGAVSWRDPALAIAWPVSESDAILSDKDAGAPWLRDLPPMFAQGPDETGAAGSAR